jgi:malate dehydrogenase (quinone)
MRPSAAVGRRGHARKPPHVGSGCRSGGSRHHERHLGGGAQGARPRAEHRDLRDASGRGAGKSDAWNNAGTGHAALCELNYTPERSDGTIDISKALDVNVEFDLSRQLWAYLVRKGAIADPQSFIHPVPHMSFVRGAEHVAYLRKRYAALTAHHCYKGMEYTEDKQKLAEWVPLVMEGRAAGEAVAATRMITGADVDYGSLTRHLIGYLQGLKASRSTIPIT